jgi:AcrR family transcriptional regulator
MPPRPGLDQVTVVQAAADLINSEGVASLTLGRLARELSIQPPSLYNHVNGLAGLHRELALLNARSLGQVMTEAVIGKSGPQAVEALCQAYRSYINKYPGQYSISLRASGNLPEPDPELQAAENQAVRVVQAVLDDFDLSGADSLHAVRGLRSLVHGFATLEAAGGFGLPLDCDDSFHRLVQMFIIGLSLK